MRPTGTRLGLYGVRNLRCRVCKYTRKVQTGLVESSDWFVIDSFLLRYGTVQYARVVGGELPAAEPEGAKCLPANATLNAQRWSLARGALSTARRAQHAPRKVTENLANTQRV